MRLRQVALVARDLDPPVDELCRALSLEVCYRDPGVGVFGLRNALMAIGDTFLEVVTPVRAGTTAGRYLERRGGDGGYMVLLQVDDLAQERRRLDGLGVRIVWEGSGAGISGMHLHPGDVGGAIVSMDVADPAGSWGWAGPSWQQSVCTDVVREIAAVEVQSPEPEVLAQRWSAALARPVAPGADGDGAAIRLEWGAIRFVPADDGRGEGIGGVDLVAGERARAGELMELAGIRIRLV
ncbi:MAG: hypothetical protein E6J14_13060 [Chloroflexi bacterium]|nr:MAG: hypothetical protein E6J14_13060 [Chloroflexota bacterium]